MMTGKVKLGTGSRAKKTLTGEPGSRTGTEAEESSIRDVNPGNDSQS